MSIFIIQHQNMTNKEFERLTFWYISEVTKSR